MPTEDELLAFAVVERVLQVDVKHHDTCGRRGAVDAILHYPDSRQAALEVTTLVDPPAAAVKSLLARDQHVWHIDGLRWFWFATFPPGSYLADLRKELPEILRWCEQHDVTAPLSGASMSLVHDSPVYDWMLRTGVTVTALLKISGRAGDVEVVPSSVGGWVGDPDIASWLTDEARSSRTSRKVDKLNASGHTERHLFLNIEATGVPFGIYDSLATGEDVPTDEPGILDLSHVWLLPVQWFSTKPLLQWTAGRGWKRHSLN